VRTSSCFATVAACSRSPLDRHAPSTFSYPSFARASAFSGSFSMTFAYATFASLGILVSRASASSLSLQPHAPSLS